MKTEYDWPQVPAAETPTESARYPEGKFVRVSPPASNGSVIYAEPGHWYSVVHADGTLERHTRNAGGYTDGLCGMVSDRALEAYRELLGGWREGQTVRFGLGAEAYDSHEMDEVDEVA